MEKIVSIGRSVLLLYLRNIALGKCKDYLQAIADFDRAVALDPQLGGVTLLSGIGFLA